MARLSFITGVRFLWQQQVYIIREVLLEGRVRVENVSFGGCPVLTEQELVAAWAAGELVFEVAGRGTRTLPDHPISTSYTWPDFQALADSADPKAQRRYAVAWYRYMILQPLLQLPPHERTRSTIQAHVTKLATHPEDLPFVPVLQGTHQPILGSRSVERWLATFTEAHGDIRALVPLSDRQGGPGQSRLVTDLNTIFTTVFAQLAAHPRQRTMAEVYLCIVNAVALENRQRPSMDRLTLPGRATTYRRIVSTTPTLPSLLRRRRSRVEAQADASVDPGPVTTRIWERVEADHTWLDLCVVDLVDRLPIGRPTLTLVRDHYSGWPVGFYVGFEPPSYRTVAHALLHAILPKPDAQKLYETQNSWPPYCYGLPELLAVDNGRDFTGHDLADACAQLGIVRELLPPQTPWWKGAVERQFRTNNTQLLHRLPGTSFSNLLERGDYDPARDACISLDGFWQILHIYFLDHYGQNWHKGVGGVPARRWAASCNAGFLPNLPHSAEEVRILLYRSETRTVQRQGIAFENLFYNSSRLAAIRTKLSKGETVRFKYNPADLGMIYVSDPTDNGRWLPVPSVNSEYTTGLSLWKHRVINDFVLRQKREVHIEDLAAAQAHIRQIVEAEFRVTRRQRTRHTAARFLGIAVSDAKVAAPTLTSQALTLANSTAIDATLPAGEESNVVTPPTATELPKTLPPPAKAPRLRKAATTVAPLTLPDLPLTGEGWGSDYGLPPRPSQEIR